MLEIPNLETRKVTAPRTRRAPSIGIIGGGQLARMTAQCAVRSAHCHWDAMS